MKRLIQYSGSVFLACFLFASCKKVTDQEPRSTITADSFFKTAADADNAITAGYDALQNVAPQAVIWGDARTDLFASTDRSLQIDFQLVNGNVDANNGNTNWNAVYTGLKRVNGVLKNVPNITDPALASRKERILGEAYYLRALFNLYLVRTFDNVPLILEPYESLDQDFYVKQANPDDVYAQIEKDLKDAESRLGDAPHATALENKGKATRGAVRATLVDYYLWRKKYQEAADASQQIISSGRYTLVGPTAYGTLFNNTARFTTESILEVQYNNTYQEGNTNGLTDRFLPLGATSPAVAGGNRYLAPSAKLMAAFAANDNRKNAAFLITGTPATPYRDPNLPYITKYLGTVAGAIRYFDANIIVYRLADVILMRAEALNELGQTPAAITLLNQIRTRAGLPATVATTQADVRLAIENERFLELAFEGKRYYDLKRTGRYATVTGFSDPNWIRWPIQNSQIIVNPNLKQNPGY